MHQISFTFFQRGITPERVITQTRKKKRFLTNRRMDNPKLVCSRNFFEMETGPQFIVSSQSLEERRTEPATLGMQSQHANHCATAIPVYVNAKEECALRTQNFAEKSTCSYS